MNVIITGASKGIGKAIAKAFAAEGATLFLCARNEVNLYNTVAELQTHYPESVIKGKAVDMSVKEEAKSFGDWVLTSLKNTNSGMVDTLVNTISQAARSVILLTIVAPDSASGSAFERVRFHTDTSQSFLSKR